MKKLVIVVLFLGVLSPVSFAKEDGKPATVAAQQASFKARRGQIKTLVKKYKKAPQSQKPAIKEELSQIVGEQVDAQLEYMKARIAAERTNLDNWERKIKADEQNLPAVKAQRVEDLLSGEAAKKQKAAKKAWREQMKKVK